MKKTEFIKLPKAEYIELKTKADKWDAYTAKLAKNLPTAKLSSKERSELARKAVQARWAKKKNTQ